MDMIVKVFTPETNVRLYCGTGDGISHTSDINRVDHWVDWPLDDAHPVFRARRGREPFLKPIEIDAEEVAGDFCCVHYLDWGAV